MNEYYCKKCDIEVGREDTLQPVMVGFLYIRVHKTCLQVVKKVDKNGS